MAILIRISSVRTANEKEQVPVNKLTLSQYNLPEWASMYLYAAHLLGASQADVHAFAASIAPELSINQKAQCRDFALRHGAHLTLVSALHPADYFQPQALSYVTHAWDARGVSYTEETATNALANLQLEMILFIETIAAHDTQFHHEKRPATADDLALALSQGAVVGLDIWRGKRRDTRMLLLGHKGELYQSYVPSADLVDHESTSEVNFNMWPSITILSRTPLQL